MNKDERIVDFGTTEWFYASFESIQKVKLKLVFGNSYHQGLDAINKREAKLAARKAKLAKYDYMDEEEKESH